MSSEVSAIPKRGLDLKTISKYFIHGLAFSVTMIILVFVWAFILVTLIAVGSFIGLIIGFIVLLFFLSGLNSFLTESIWSVSVRTEWMSLLGHGFVLFIVLLLAHIPGIIVDLVFPSFIWAMFFFEAFVDGFVAKNVAGWWKEETVDLGMHYPKASRSETMVGMEDTMKYCPNCGKKIPNGFKVCPHCVLEVNAVESKEDSETSSGLFK